MTFTLTAGTPPDLPYPARRTDLAVRSMVLSVPLTIRRPTDSAQVGHNTIWATVSYGYLDDTDPPDLRLYADRLSRALLVAILADLRKAD
jgi:hypothetical protein